MRYAIIVICVICFFLPVDIAQMGFYKGSPLYTHISYMFFHRDLIHLATNMVAFYFVYSGLKPKTSLLFLVLIGSIVISFFSELNSPTVGLSGMIFIMIGYFSANLLSVYDVQKYIPFFTFALLSITVSFLLPNTNGLIHFLGFVLGYFSSLIKHIIYDSNGIRY